MHKPSKVCVYVSDTRDTSMNLAYEEYFMKAVPADEWVVFWWQSKHTVVIGRNQNPYQECHIEHIKRDQVNLVRRLSGGGAVYHDLGNLNFSFISKGEVFSPELHFEILLEGLSRLGIEGTFTGRNDLTVLGRKFSGNAFIHEDEQHLHHGTLLIDAAVDKLGEYLNVSHSKLDTKGFDSIKSRVINLKEIVPELTQDMIIEAITEAIKIRLGCRVEHQALDLHFNELAQVYVDKYRSDFWNYGDTPTFDQVIEARFPWGHVQIALMIECGMIRDARISTDALEAESFSNLPFRLKGVPLLPDSLYRAISESSLKKEMKNDLYSMMMNAFFK